MASSRRRNEHRDARPYPTQTEVAVRVLAYQPIPSSCAAQELATFRYKKAFVVSVIKGLQEIGFASKGDRQILVKWFAGPGSGDSRHGLLHPDLADHTGSLDTVSLLESLRIEVMNFINNRIERYEQEIEVERAANRYKRRRDDDDHYDNNIRRVPTMRDRVHFLA